MEIFQLLLLLVHDLLVLELEQLPFFFEVGHNLPQTLLQELNLRPEKLNLLVFFELTLGVLLHRHSLLLQIVCGLLVVQLQLSVPVVEIGQLLVLELGFLAEAEVLNHDIPLYLRYVLFGLLDGILTEVIQHLSVGGIDLLFLPLTVLSALLLHLVVQTEQGYVTVFLILDLLLFHHLLILELEELFLGFQEGAHLALLLVLLLLIALIHVYLLCVKPGDIRAKRG